MIIGERLKQFREQKGFSQGDIEHRTGLFRCYVSRCENGHTVPSIETLEKWARALEIPLYQLFVGVGQKVDREAIPRPTNGKGLRAADRRFLNRMASRIVKISDRDKKIVFFLLSKMAARTESR